VENARALVEAYLYDVKTRQQVLGKRYTISDTTLIRRIAHEFADQVVFQLSAGTSRGVARSQIAFTSLKGGSKEVYVMDYDGSNERTITANGGLNLFPEWSADNAELAFVSMLPNVHRWQLWIQNLQGGHRIVPTPTSYVSSPAMSPTAIVFSARQSGKTDPDIYVSDFGMTRRKNLTNHSAIDTSPTWSPTGQQIAFISDRSGTPQLWMVDSDGSNLQRLVSEGGHCDSPDWSPDGRFVLYSWQAPGRWKHDVYVIEVATRKIFQLTSGMGSHENPAWSPDGRHIVFQSTRTGSKQIFIMNADGKNLKQVTAYGINESPAWSHYVEAEQPE
jgi:TolB protein